MRIHVICVVNNANTITVSIKMHTFSLPKQNTSYTSILFFWYYQWSFQFYHLHFRGRLLGAEYLPVKIKFDKEKKLLHPEPTRNAEWIKVCAKEDRQCQPDCKTKDDEMRHNTNKWIKSLDSYCCLMTTALSGGGGRVGGGGGKTEG